MRQGGSSEVWGGWRPGVARTRSSSALWRPSTLPVGRVVHRFFDLLDVFGDLLQRPRLVLESLHLVLVAHVVGVAASLQEQGVYRPLGIVALALTILLIGGDRDALRKALLLHVFHYVLLGVPRGEANPRDSPDRVKIALMLWPLPFL